MSEDKVLEVPCFGQSFQLGTLYDCRSHHLVLGPTLWESDIVKNSSVSRASPQSRYEVFTDDTLEEKMAMLGVDSSLKLSLMTGLVRPSGIGNFILDQKSSKKQARVTLKYESTSKFDALSLDQVRKEVHRDISEEITATHFVSGIEYGTQAVFVFDRDVAEKERNIDVENDLKFTVDSLPRVAADGRSSFYPDEKDVEELKKIKCTLYGNQTMASFKRSVSYQDAVMAYSTLNTSENPQIGEVPKKVWLHPLSSLDPTIERPVKEISSQVTDGLQDIITGFDDLQTRVSVLLENNVCSIFSSLKRHISRCGKAVSEYKKKLLKTLSSLLPVVRSGDEVEKILTDVLDKVASSPFHQTYLSSWISGKEKEVKLLSTYLEYLKDIQLVLSLEDLDSVVDSLDYDRVVCFSLVPVSDSDDMIEQMYNFLRSGSWDQERLAAKSWFEYPEIINDIKSKARIFRGFANENGRNGNTKFIFTNIHRSTDEKFVMIHLYEDGHASDFEPPGKPEKPYATEKSNSSITLEWKGSPLGINSVQKYTVRFRPVSDSGGEPSEEWKSVQTAGPENVITVDGLEAKTAYLFMVNSECKAGRSDVSDFSDRIRTSCEESVARSQSGSSSTESELLNNKKKGCTSDLAAGGSTNNLATPSTSSSHVEVPQNMNITCPKSPIQKPPEKGRHGTPRGGKGSNSKGTAYFVPIRPAEFMLSSSKKITDGSPSVYKLSRNERMRRESSMIARQSIGRAPRGVKGRLTEKVLMVVGATGAGKTTLINGMVNFILGVDWKDPFRYKLVVDNKGVSQANSQTKDITAYTFYPMKGSAIPYTFTIIDTPGFGDTEGLKRDKFITSQIKEFFSIPPPNGIDHLDGIGFVTQASLARLTPPQEYIFNSVLSIFGNDVCKNIFMMLTFADGQQPPVLEAIKKANIPSDKYFKFNNSALFAENKETAESFDAMFWKMGYLSFQNFFAEFEKTESVSLRLTKEVLSEREQLQTLIEGLNPQITKGLNKIEEMRQEELVLQHHVKEIETNKDFTYEVEVTKPHYVDLKGTGRHTTTCLKCNYTCHQDCMIADDCNKRGCWAMDKTTGDCRICTLNCIWSDHKNLPYLIEYETVTETRTSADLQAKYETAVSGKSKVEGMIQQLELFLQGVHTGVMTMIHRAQQSLHRLDEIALKPNPLTQVQYLELLIESEKNEAKPGWKQRVQYFEEAKRHAMILSKVKDAKEAQKIIQGNARSGEGWYSRFKYWLFKG